MFQLLFVLSISFDLSLLSAIINILELDRGITQGASIKGKTAKQLQTGRYTVEASGRVINYSRWPLSVVWSENAEGVVMTKLGNANRMIDAAQEEGFSTRHASDTATGIWMRHSLVIDDDIMLHFMYTTPYSHDFHHNWLGVAACMKVNPVCQSMDASKMYYEKYPFLKRKEFYRRLGAIAICYDNVCLLGHMGAGHSPVVEIRVLPKSFFDLDPTIREKLEKLNQKEYEDYLNSLSK